LRMLRNVQSLPNPWSANEVLGGKTWQRLQLRGGKGREKKPPTEKDGGGGEGQKSDNAEANREGRNEEHEAVDDKKVSAQAQGFSINNITPSSVLKAILWYVREVFAMEAAKLQTFSLLLGNTKPPSMPSCTRGPPEEGEEEEDEEEIVVPRNQRRQVADPSVFEVKDDDDRPTLRQRKRKEEEEEEEEEEVRANGG
jgi:hypothetical protein